MLDSACVSTRAVAIATKDFNEWDESGYSGRLKATYIQHPPLLSTMCKSEAVF